MPNIKFQFDRTKAIESILYLAQRVSDADVYGISKLLYLADKTSLEKYGRFIFGDTYTAMEEGPVPSQAYDLMKLARKSPVNGLRIDVNHRVVPERDPDTDWLSESDIECLNQIVDIYGRVPNWMRSRDAHDDAWRKAWDKRGNKKSVTIPATRIAELLSDSENLIDYITHRNS